MYSRTSLAIHKPSVKHVLAVETTAERPCNVAGQGLYAPIRNRVMDVHDHVDAIIKTAQCAHNLLVTPHNDLTARGCAAGVSDPTRIGPAGIPWKARILRDSHKAKPTISTFRVASGAVALLLLAAGPGGLYSPLIETC